MSYYPNKYSKSSAFGSKYGAGFTPKKPVHSFRDLEVYQTAMNCSVLIVKDLRPQLVKLKYPFLENMINCCMSIPLFVGEAHSTRFNNFNEGVSLLEKAMASCNKMIIYLEQIVGLYGSKVKVDLIEDIIKRYAENRGKMFRLEKSWKKFKESYPEGKQANAGQSFRH